MMTLAVNTEDRNKDADTLFGHTKINRIHHGWSVEIGKSQPEGPPVPVGNEARRVSHRNGGPEGWDFPFSTDHP